jgi:pyruvate formate lyase activating enzyme
LRHDGRIHIEREKCIACGACAEVCPTAALVKIGQRMTVDAVMDVVRRDRVFYAERGGVTVTGGEPMSQPAFTIALAKAAKKAGISVFVETSGYGREADFLSLLPYCDTFLFDCKAADEDHALLTGVNRAVILRNLDAICREGGRVRLRCPIVPDANLSDALIQTISSLAATYDAIESVQLMPYHKTGIGKSERLGKIPQPTFSVPDREQLETIARQIEKQSDKRVFF